jgi:hypothetical protein
VLLGEFVVQIGKSSSDKIYAASILKTRVLLRKFDYESLIDELVSYINNVKFDPKAETQDLPWVAERLLIWLLSDHPRNYRAQIAGYRDIKFLVDHAWHETKWSDDQEKLIPNYRLTMRALVLPQLPFQRSYDQYLLAWQLALLDRLQDKSKLLKHFHKQAGFTPARYLELAFFFSVLTPQQKAAHHAIDRNAIQQFASIFPVNEQLIVLKQASRTVDQLREVYSTRTIRAEEWFWPNPFAEAPFLNKKNSCIPLGTHNIQRHVNTRLTAWAAMDTDLLQDFDELVSRYVGDRLTEVGLTALNESQIRNKFKITGQVIDYLLEGVDYFCLVEVKNKWLLNEKLATQRPSNLGRELKAIVPKGTAQIANTEQAILLQTGQASKEIIRVLVITDDLFLPSEYAAYADQPRIILSLKSWDLLLEGVALKSWTLQGVLKEYLAKQNDPEKSTLFFSQFFDSEIGKKTRTPTKLNAKLHEMQNRWEASLLSCKS